MNSSRPATGMRLKTGHILGAVGTATRLTTAMRPGTRGGLEGSTLNTLVYVEDRPITQQGMFIYKSTILGLGGLKTAAYGPKRQIEDKPYFLGVLRGKINEINGEIEQLFHKSCETEEEIASYVQYEQMAEKLALEIKELQGELGDCNTLVDKATMGDDVGSVELDWDDIRIGNERAEQSLESLFDSRQTKESSLKAAETELNKIKQLSESLIYQMNDHDRQTYVELKSHNDHLLKQLDKGQHELEQLINQKLQMEADMSNSQIKQEAVKLYAQLRETQTKRDQLTEEDAAQTDPQLESQRLLTQVREDNQEIVNIERQTREVKDKIKNCEGDVAVLEQELDENQTEQMQKLKELKKREQQIDEYFEKFEDVKSTELNKIVELEQQIVNNLETISRYLQNTDEIMTIPDASNMMDKLNLKQLDTSKTVWTVSSLAKHRGKLSQELLKVGQLEMNVTKELETLKSQIATMEEEIGTFSKLDKVREDVNIKIKSLTAQLDQLSESKINLEQTNHKLETEYDQIDAELNQHDTYVQLKLLEKRWIQVEQVNHRLHESIADKIAESDYSLELKNALKLVNSYHDTLKQILVTKPAIVI